jgi:hypothetical protein
MESESEFEATRETSRLSYVTTRRAWAKQVAGSKNARNY